jgi:hypothetical protein
MKPRTGKECKQTKCILYVTYVNWEKNLGNAPLLNRCRNCKHAHVSQYINQFKLQEKLEKRNNRIAKW